ncbi:MAG: tetratricopeptide repeat protein [Deltaproteobacteria bacterium]|nr:tetratricopeptide repeat protein [Deltaproteobacteria bacterium]
MYLVQVFIVALFLVASNAYAQQSPYKEAQKSVEEGDYRKALEILQKLTASEPKNGKYRQLLGDVYRKEGRNEEALSEYEMAKTLGGENVELLKNIGTVQKRQKNTGSAIAAYKRALQLNPNDREAKDDLASLEKGRGLSFRAALGGAEADYTTDSYEASLSYGGFDKLNLNAGYSYADNIYYTRDKFYLSGYYFFLPDSYFKVFTAYKNYDYPPDPAIQKPNPDTNSYDTVPAIEFEVSHWIKKNFRGTVAYEYFRPSFFYDQDSTASNHKLSTELYYITPLEYLRIKLMYAILRDPDSDSTEIKGRDNLNTPLGTASETDVRYKTSSLFGAGAELVFDRWDAELKYIPNRDLDSSYEYSILTGVGYDFTDKLTGRFDYVHDKYSSRSAYSGQNADVYLVSVFYEINPSIDLGVGLKRLSLPSRDDNAGFLTLSYKTGLGL